MVSQQFPAWWWWNVPLERIPAAKKRASNNQGAGRMIHHHLIWPLVTMVTAWVLDYIDLIIVPVLLLVDWKMVQQQQQHDLMPSGPSIKNAPAKATTQARLLYNSQGASYPPKRNSNATILKNKQPGGTNNFDFFFALLVSIFPSSFGGEEEKKKLGAKEPRSPDASSNNRKLSPSSSQESDGINIGGCVTLFFNVS